MLDALPQLVACQSTVRVELSFVTLAMAIFSGVADSGVMDN